MNIVKVAVLLAGAATVSACTEGLEMGSYGPDKSIDRGINAHHLSTLVAGVWIDPNGCDHWIIDDGVEGYLSPRLTPDGLPVCSGVGAPEQAVGPFKAGTPIPDTL